MERRTPGIEWRYLDRAVRTAVRRVFGRDWRRDWRRPRVVGAAVFGLLALASWLALIGLGGWPEAQIVAGLLACVFGGAALLACFDAVT